MPRVFIGYSVLYCRAAAVGSLGLLAGISLLVSVWFYAVRLDDTVPWLGYAISALALWCLVFLGLMSMFVFPALVQKKVGTLETLRVTALVVLDNPVFSVGLAVQLVVWCVIAVVPLATVLLSGSAAVVLISSAYEMLSRKYAAALLDRNPGMMPDRPIHAAIKNGVLVFDDEKDEYLNRGLRDFLFPWKG